MKKRVLGILLAGVLTLALAGCAGDSNTESNSTDSNTTSQVEQSESSDTTSDTMDEASYMEKVNALPDAMTDFSNDMAEIMSTMSTAASQEDLDALLSQLEDLRAYEQPYYDFAAIDNPPEKYAQAHERLANASTQMGDVLDEYIDLMKGILEGTVSDEDAQAISDKMATAADEIAQAGQELTSIQ